MGGSFWPPTEMLPTKARSPVGSLATSPVREYSGTGYGLRFPTEAYGNERERTVFQESLQEACFVFTEISESLRKPPGVYGIM